MRMLFTLDRCDHGRCTRTFVRDSARAVIIKNGKIALVHSLKYDYYKFPGGGIEPGESMIDAVIRETAEEAGLTVIPETVSEYGCVHRVQKLASDHTARFVQDNYYFLCAAEDGTAAQQLDDYESEERFTPVWADPADAIRTNRTGDHGPKDPFTLEREARVLEMLLAEGYFAR